jgi:hypothetical protein
MVEMLVNLPYLALAIFFAVATILFTDYIQEIFLYKKKEFLDLVKNIQILEGRIQKEEKKVEVSKDKK